MEGQESNDEDSLNSRQTWISGYSPEELHTMQQDDSDLAPILESLEKGLKDDWDTASSFSPATRKLWLNWDNLILQDGVMYQRWLSIDKKNLPEQRQLLVPMILREEVIKQCHGTLLAGHFGVEKTTQAVKRRFYWYRMGRDIRRHIHECPACSANRQPVHSLKAALKDYRVGYPLDRVALDILGPLPQSRRGNTCLLVVADYFTRWVEAYPMSDQQAATTANKLVIEFISRFGVPLELHSDQLRNFESDLFQQVCKLLAITKTRSTPYHPASNGLVERFNRTLAKMIRSFIGENQLDWDAHIPLLTAAYRSTIHPATGFTPNYLMLGREVNLPVDVLYPMPSIGESQNVHQYATKLKEKMQDCYKLARKNLQQAAIRQKRDYDVRIVENQYEPGDLVFKRYHVHKKLEVPWFGPFVVVKSVGGAIYEIANKKKRQIVHHDLLKPYTSSFIPNWVTKLVERLKIADRGPE